MEVTIQVNYKNENLQRLRREADLSQSQMAKTAGVNLRVYQYYEQGIKDVSKAQLATQLKICNALRCRLSEIVTDADTLEQLKIYEK